MYPISTNFLPQTKVEINMLLSFLLTRHLQEEYDIYKIGLPWISKGEYAKSKHRILIQRHPKNLFEKEPSKKKSESPRKKKGFDEYDSAFYFEKVEDVRKLCHNSMA